MHKQKRALLSFLAVASILTISYSAHAEWMTKEIKWRISSVGAPWSGTAIYVRDTTYNAVGGGASDVGDTTASFTLDDATVLPRGAGGIGGGLNQAGNANQNDSCVVAWLLIVSDSSVATTATATNVTAIIDGAVGNFGAAVTLGESWVKADSAFINGAAGGTMATGQDSYGIPIKTISPYGNVLRWPILRARISTATGSIPAARVYLRYNRPDITNHQ